MKPPFRYPGGKFYAIKYIVPILDSIEHDEYREPFVGGGSIFFAKNKVKFNWLNDLDNELIKTYQAISDSPLCEELIKMLKHEVATPIRHSEIKQFIPKNHLETAYKTYYLNRTSYCGIINKPAWGYKIGKSSPPKNWGMFLKEANTKLNNTLITCKDFSEIIVAKRNGENVLMYLDPPYFHADQKRAYTKPFSDNDHLRLAKLLRHTSYKFCLSYDDCAEIRDLYSWAYINERKWFYNTANCKNGQRKKGNELIITNYKVDLGPLFYD